MLQGLGWRFFVVLLQDCWFFSLPFQHGLLCGRCWLSISQSLPSPRGSFRLFLIYNPSNLQFPWYLPSTRDVSQEASKPYEVTEGSSVSPVRTELHQQRGTGRTFSFSLLLFPSNIGPSWTLSPCVAPYPTAERAHPSVGSASPHRPTSHPQHLLRGDNLGATTLCKRCRFHLAATQLLALWWSREGGREREEERKEGRKESTVSAQTTPAKPRGLSAAMQGGKSQ